ncbi:uncharacterized protein LOC104421094 [Eucalyptus grandis]|uniref:uncharacterized protein LOC104421094 n=1 Tax=Eucalyptus grandis TaxID=71139 RepID=UPI00192E93B4|nr:uncharacterized protein LOC104421094 [Eucalyptus grandis]
MDTIEIDLSDHCLPFNARKEDRAYLNQTPRESIARCHSTNMASQYLAIIFIVCAFCSIDDTGAASGPCPFPPDCRCRSPACRPPNPAKADEVKTPRIAEEPAVPNSLRYAP